jgi:hypothetical protein
VARSKAKPKVKAKPATKAKAKPKSSGSSGSFDAILAKLAAAVAAHPDPTYASTHRFIDGASVTAKQLDATRKPYPPSFRDALIAHGLFSLGDTDAAHSQLVYRCWPLAQHRSALAEYADQLGCEATADAVSEEIGVDAELVGALDQMILIGVEGHEDYVGFDLRTRNAKTGECRFGLVLFDDTEIDALANEATRPCAVRGFDAWLAKHVARRA